jgi:hypothetical protein
MSVFVNLGLGNHMRAHFKLESVPVSLSDPSQAHRSLLGISGFLKNKNMKVA